MRLITDLRTVAAVRGEKLNRIAAARRAGIEKKRQEQRLQREEAAIRGRHGINLITIEAGKVAHELCGQALDWLDRHTEELAIRMQRNYEDDVAMFARKFRASQLRMNNKYPM